MPKRLRLKAGDIFVFDLDDARWGAGQVVEPGGVFLTTILAPAYPKGIEIADIDPEDILLTGWTMDGWLFHGFWSVIGRREVAKSVPRPCSQVNIGDDVWVQDYRCRPIRKATANEAKRLNRHTSSSPMIFEDAFSRLLKKSLASAG